MTCSTLPTRPATTNSRPCATRGVDVAHGRELVVAGLVGSVEQVIHAAAGTDGPDEQRVVGAKDASGCEGGEPGSDEKSTAIDFVFHGEHLSGSGGRRKVAGEGFAVQKIPCPCRMTSLHLILGCARAK